MGYDDAQFFMQGSSASRVKYATQEALDARLGSVPGDYDIAIVSPKLLAKAEELGLNVLDGKLTPQEVFALGLSDVQDILSKASKGGIPVEFKVYVEVIDVYNYGKTIPFSPFLK